MLSSVFGKRKNFQKRLNDFAHRIPTARAPSPPSPGSFASPDVTFDPYRLYKNASELSLGRPPPPISQNADSTPSTSSGSGTASSKRISSPKVQIDFDHETDWFPPELLHMRSESEPMSRPERNVSLGAKSSTTYSSVPAGTTASSSISVLTSNTSITATSVTGNSGAGKAMLLDVTRRRQGDEDGRYGFGEDDVMVIGAPSPSPRGRDVRIHFTANSVIY